MTLPLHYTVSDEGDRILEIYAEKIHEGYVMGFNQVVPMANVLPWKALSDEEKHAYRIGVQHLLSHIVDKEEVEVDRLVKGQVAF